MATETERVKPTKKKPNWTPEAREAARQRAYKLIEEGKFGGAPGRGGRPKNRSPRANDLLLILRKLSDRTMLFEQERELLRSAALIAPLLGGGDEGGLDLDREHGDHLIALGVRQLLADGTLTTLIRLDGEEVVEMVKPRSGEHKKRLIEKMGSRGRVVDLSQFAVLDARTFRDAEVIECACLLGVLSPRPLLRSAVVDMVRDLYTQVIPLIAGALERRGVTAEIAPTS